MGVFITGTISNITVRRTRGILGDVVELPCSDYQVEGEFRPYRRLSDFFWQILSKKVIPKELKRREASEGQGDFISEVEMLPACITMLSEQTDKSQYLMTCMDKKMTTTYHVWLTISDAFFRQSGYKVSVSDVSIRIEDRGRVRSFRSLGVTEEGFDAYWDLASALGDTLRDCLVVDFSGTDEEDASMYYLTPDWLEVESLAFSLVKEKSGKYRWSSCLPGGAFRAEATFNLVVS